MLALASLTQPLVNFATSLIGSAGYGGVVLLMTITGVVGLPGTEPTMLFAGFDVYNHTLSLPGIIAAGVVGDVLGASIAYAIGYYAGRELLARQGSKLHVSQRRLDRGHSWFERYGAPTVFVSRFLPVVRLAFPYAAGAAKMPYIRFVVLAALGSLFWVSGLAVLGREVGSNWTSWRHHLEYVDYVGAAVLVAAIVWLFVRWRRGRSEPEPAADATSV
ncbi:MAG TPA: DedA family protein [Solirubrobacteraceae bacterium]|nr:DedA family protein [Solirubrobacteraceae bacterium]